MGDSAGPPEPRWQPKAAIAEAELDGERVIWDPESGTVTRLDRLGSLIWAHLDGTTSLDELCGDLSEAFDKTPDSVRAEVDPFVAHLSGLGLLVAGPGEADPPGTATPIDSSDAVGGP